MSGDFFKDAADSVMSPFSTDEVKRLDEQRTTQGRTLSAKSGQATTTTRDGIVSAQPVAKPVDTKTSSQTDEQSASQESDQTETQTSEPVDDSPSEAETPSEPVPEQVSTPAPQPKVINKKPAPSRKSKPRANKRTNIRSDERIDVPMKSPGRPSSDAPVKNPDIQGRKTVPGIPAELLYRARDLFRGSSISNVSNRDVIEAVLALYIGLDPRDFPLDVKAERLVQTRRTSLSSTENVNNQLRLIRKNIQSLHDDLVEVRATTSHLMSDYQGIESLNDDAARDRLSDYRVMTPTTEALEATVRHQALEWDRIQREADGRLRSGDKARKA